MSLSLIEKPVTLSLFLYLCPCFLLNPHSEFSIVIIKNSKVRVRYKDVQAILLRGVKWEDLKICDPMYFLKFGGGFKVWGG